MAYTTHHKKTGSPSPCLLQTSSILPITQRNFIPGDFNIHLDDVQENDALAFSDTMMALGFNQCVNSSIHIHGNKLDLVFTEAGSDLAVSSCTTGIFIFYHKLVTATLNIRKWKLERKPLNMTKIKNVTFDTFQQELRSEKLNCDGLLDSVARSLKIKLRGVLDTLAPEWTNSTD